MLIQFLYLVGGFALLYAGAEFLVKGSASLARSTGIRPVVIALTIVAFGVSSPEFVVSANASLHHVPSISIGNVIGSIITNTGLILGLAAIVRPLKTEFRLLKKEVPILIICELVFILFALDAKIDRFEGALFLIGFLIFNLYCIREARRNIKDRKELSEEYQKHIAGLGRLTLSGVSSPAPKDRAWAPSNGSKKINIFLIVLGLMGLFGGSQLVVVGAVTLAKTFSINPFIIAASLVAFGTALPELTTSVVAAARGEFDISVGNVIGSNIFNVLMCIGFAALISPLSVETHVIKVDIFVMLFLSLALGLFMWTHLKIKRWEGALLVFIYIGYLIHLFYKPFNL